MHRARKRFGQNFLCDQSVVERIVRSIAITDTDHLVEIGPGKGSLTDHLLGANTLTLIEIDRDLVPLLRQRYLNQTLAPTLTSPTSSASPPVIRILEQDALTVDFGQLIGDDRSEVKATKERAQLKVVGNLPYNISSPLLFHLLTFLPNIQVMIFMLQEEVVDRMVAKPGSRVYGRLSVMIQYACQVDKLFSVHPESFDPAPKVMSAVVRIVPRARQRAKDEACLSELVAKAFQWRRKTMKQTLKTFVGHIPDDYESLAVKRPEQLSVENFVELADLVYNTRIVKDKE